MKRIKKLFITMFLLALMACNSNTKLSDAYGNFESQKITISAESTGRILNLTIQEGTKLSKDLIVGQIDTMDLYFKLQQMRAQISALKSNLTTIQSQKDVLLQQKKNLGIENQRMQQLYKSGAATLKQKDDLEGNMQVVEKQILATESQNLSISNQIQGLISQYAAIELAISKCTIKNPIDGVVLNQLAYQDEITAPGKALYTIADMSSLDLKVYISGNQLSNIKLGQEVEVKIDGNKNDFILMKGKVSWVSDVAEFTPKTIQTKEERVNYVYAVKVKVANTDGLLKIGMPGEINFMPKLK